MADRARAGGIEPDIKVVVPQELKVSSYDMNVLLGNLIQNAIEAAENSEKKELGVSVRYSDGSLVITITNSMQGNVRRRGEVYLTTKTEPGHGLGIKSARNIVEKYSGSMFFEEGENSFTVKVILFGV